MRDFVILASAAALCLFYGICRLLLVCAARKELAKSALTKKAGGELLLFAEAESLEFYLRCALAAFDERKTPIVVQIPRADPACADMTDTVARMQAAHPNIRYRLL